MFVRNLETLGGQKSSLAYYAIFGASRCAYVLLFYVSE